LLVQLEAALPSWLLNHVEVRYSFQSTEDEKTLRQWIQHVTRAADEPNANEASPYTEQLTKVKQNLFELNERLSDIRTSLDQHTDLLKSLAICVRHQMKQDLKASSQLNLKESGQRQSQQQIEQPSSQPSMSVVLPSVREESEDEQVALPPSQPSVLGVLSPVQEAADDDV
jgi:thioredoxin-like negative regulator of GroEL